MVRESVSYYRIFEKLGADGIIYARASEGQDNHLYRLKEDGTERQKVVPSPVIGLGSLSPDGRWILALVPSQSEDHPIRIMAIPTGGGSSRPICDACDPGWSADGKYFVITTEALASMAQLKTYVVPLRNGETFPPLPPSGLTSAKEAADLRGVRVINRTEAVIGADPATYAFTETTVHRNLFRIPLP